METTVLVNKDRYDAVERELNALRGLRQQVAQHVLVTETSIKAMVVNCELKEKQTMESGEGDVIARIPNPMEQPMIQRKSWLFDKRDGSMKIDYDRMPHDYENVAAVDFLDKLLNDSRAYMQAFDCAMVELLQSRKVIDKLKASHILGLGCAYGAGDELLSVAGEPIPDREVVIEYDKETGHYNVRLR